MAGTSIFYQQQGKLRYKIITVIPIFIILLLSSSCSRLVKEKESNLQKEYKPIFEKYLAERYPDKMKVEQVYYNSQTGEYSCYAYPINNVKAQFYAFEIKDTNTQNLIFRDNYMTALWQIEIEKELMNQLSSILPNIYSIDVKIMGKPVYYIGRTWYVFEFNDYTPKSKIPTFDEVRKDSYIKEIYKTIDIYINNQDTQISMEKEYEKILKVIELVRREEYNPTSLTISYGSGNKSNDNINFTSKAEGIFTFYNEDINRINSIDDLKLKQRK